MKKKKLTGKLSLNKSKISNLDGSKIMGGFGSGTGGPHDASQCVPFCGGGTISVGVGCTISENTGSECRCL